MRILYMGTPDFAVSSLKRLYDDGHEIIGVFTKPDMPQGRKMIMTPPEVKVLAEQLNLTLYQPTTLKDEQIQNTIRELAPDLIAVVAYGKLLPKAVLDIPKYGCINVHGSLLPKYRGAAPIQWSVINGDKLAGVTTMYMAEGLDAGDMLMTYSTEILPDETSGELYERLKVAGADLLSQTVVALQNETAQRKPQNEDEVTLAPMLSKELAQLDFTQKAQVIHDKVRGMNPWPVAHTTLDGQTLKIYQTRMTDKTTDKACGIVISSDAKTGLFVACAEGTVVEILQIQPVGKKRMSVNDYLRGKTIEVGTTLGN